ncbi:MAG: hypothetical protein DMG67_14850 [Acidobacteria bacterium]|nr:MAG: hypothetical protein DMG67_14850 [Acidobacteriota bacterium]
MVCYGAVPFLLGTGVIAVRRGRYTSGVIILCMAAGFSIEQKPATKFRLQKGVGKMPNATAGETRALLVKPTDYLLFTRLGMLSPWC